ncbi:MAG: hypothetical protein JNL08_17420 [Planctomycetes bacterium]|nr:hypothetical protein [Planctomycetota bacterium]
MPPHHAIPKLCALAVLSSALWFGACQGGANKVAYGVTASQFQDMVVPAGMRLRDGTNESYSRQEAGWRLGHFVYEGPTAVDEAMGYVRQRMPQHNWQKVEDKASENEPARLRFERGIYTAEYTFERREGATHMVVRYTTDYSRP